MVNQLLSTTEYKLFKTAKVNRAVSTPHVAKLVKAIKKKNLLHLNPLIVDKDLNVIDGQHRLAAAKQLKLQVYYLVDYHISENDIADLNSNKNNWKPIDYINFYCNKGNEEYIKLRDFMKAHPQIDTSTILRICCTSHFNISNVTKDGTYSANNIAGAEDLLSKASDFPFDGKYSRNFLVALRQCVESGEYNHENMILQIERQPGKLIKMGNEQQYVELLEKLFNFRLFANIANFRLSKAARERQEAKRMKELQKLQKKSERSSTEGKFAKDFLEEKKPLQPAPVNGNKVPVKIDSKTTIYAPPGIDPDQYREQYLRNLHRSQSNLKGIKSLNLK